jgi:3-deoxy-7-phosphoheptulonate synthase
LRKRFENEIVVVMRAYFEKPRTVAGWKGLVYDPDLDGSHRINKGLRMARTLLAEISEMGIPCGTEFLDPTVPQHISDFISWGAIGARTVESQTHRELASGLSMPIGFKNATDGRVQPAVDAVLAARMPHWFASNTRDGLASHFQSTGNDTGHIVLRGGSKSGPNYDEAHVAEAVARLRKAGLSERLMVDCSHGNSAKDHTKQRLVAEEVARQIAGGSDYVLGLMIESNLVSGRQEWSADGELIFGQSVTDACVDLKETESMLESLSRAAR